MSSPWGRPVHTAAAGAELEPKRRRRRTALSCAQCKQRKIKCDRNEPCNSCVIRGMGDQCRWRDEREPQVGRAPVRRKKNGEKFGREEGEGGIDVIVDAVMRKIQSRKRRADTSSSTIEAEGVEDEGVGDEEDGSDASVDYGGRQGTSVRTASPGSKATPTSAYHLPFSMEERLRYDVKPAINTVAQRLPLTAFEGAKKAHPFFHQGINADADAYLPESTVIPSLQQLPNRRIVDALLKVYMDELEPVKNLFNRHILAEQLEELWDDMAQWNVQTDQPISTPIYYENGDRAGVLDVHFDDRHTPHTAQPSTSATIRHRLLSTARQGLIALVFTLCDIGARLIDMPTLIEIGLVPKHDTEAQMLNWCDTMGSRASYHLKLSEYAARPTLWALQVMLLNDISISAMVKWRQGMGKAYDNHFVTSGLMLSIAVSLGLNNLGSAYDDVRSAADRARQLDRQSGSDTDQKKESASAKQQKHVLATMQHGTWIVEFAEGNLAHRELGRKLWAMVLTMDALMASHFNQHYNVHDNIDHTAPPAPVDDADLISPHAALIIAQSRPDGLVPRDNTFVAYYAAISRVTRMQVEMENVKGAPLPYSDLLYLDRRFRDVVDLLPPFLSLNLTNNGPSAVQTPLPASVSDSQDPRTQAFNIQRCMINDHANFRMLRMHRMHLGKGFKDKKYRLSTLTCLKCARGILEARSAMDPVDRTIRHALFLLNHLLQAAFVFQLYLLHELDQRRKGSKAKSEDDGVYRLDDFDGTVVQLQRCLHYLGPGSTVNRNFAKEQISAVEAFLINLQRGTAKKVANPKSESTKRRVRGRQSATERSPFTSLRTSETPTYSGGLQSASDTNADGHRSDVVIDMGSTTTATSASETTSYNWAPALGSHDSTASLAIDAYDPSIWSLDALFSGYEEGTDLISALENEVLTNNANAWLGFGNVDGSAHTAWPSHARR